MGTLTSYIAMVLAVLAFLGAFGIHRVLQPSAVPALEPQWWGPGTEDGEVDTSIRPISIKVPDSMLQDLQRRLNMTKFGAPPLEAVHFQYGFNSDTLKKVVEYWRTDYKWREREAYLNKYQHFQTRVQGLDIHYVHVRPSQESLSAAGGLSLPLLLLHGWPGSILEFYTLVPLLTDVERSRKAGFALELVIPSLPGYGWSQGAVRPGLGPVQMGLVLAQLMKRLGHERWYVQGGDWGSQVASHMAVLQPEAVLGLHLNFCYTSNIKSRVMILLASLYPSLFVEDRFARRLYPLGKAFGNMLLETGYLHIQATKPDTVGAALSDSPAGLAAYILEKFSTGTNLTYRDTDDGGLTIKFTYDDLLDNVMIYWLTNTMTTAMRIYAEAFSSANRKLGYEEALVPVPTWCARFPNEIVYLPDWILKYRYPLLRGSTDMQVGGHFAAMEVPHLLADDVWLAIDHFRKESR